MTACKNIVYVQINKGWQLSIPLKIIVYVSITRYLYGIWDVEKDLPAMQETGVRSLGWEDPLEKRKATHFSILAWRIP